jgi:hypothetical protein
MNNFGHQLGIQKFSSDATQVRTDPPYLQEVKYSAQQHCPLQVESTGYQYSCLANYTFGVLVVSSPSPKFDNAPRTTQKGTILYNCSFI